jgi:hypothetical protein
VRSCGNGFAAVSAEGTATVLDPGLRVVGRHELGDRVGDVAIAPDGVTWAWAAGGRLWFGTPGGTAVDVPVSGQVACRWQSSGRTVWVAVGTGDEVRVELRDLGHRVLGEVTVPDPFGGAMVMLCDHPDDDAVVLWVAAGQDGQQSWLLTGGTTPAAELLPADDCRPALFTPDGQALVAADDERLALLAWPGGTERGVLTWADADPEAAADWSDGPGEVLLLPGGLAAWTSGNGRIRTVDLATASVVDEVCLAGHPVGAIAEVYPSLAGDENPCADFEFAVPGAGGTVLSVHRRRTLVLSALADWVPAR